MPLKPRIVPPAERAAAICRGPIQLSRFETDRPRQGLGYQPKRRASLPLLLLALVYLLGLATALIVVAVVAGGPACDPASSLPWLHCLR